MRGLLDPVKIENTTVLLFLLLTIQARPCCIWMMPVFFLAFWFLFVGRKKCLSGSKFTKKQIIFVLKKPESLLTKSCRTANPFKRDYTPPVIKNKHILCSISKFCQHLFENWCTHIIVKHLFEKWCTHIIVNWPRNSRMTLKFK